MPAKSAALQVATWTKAIPGRDQAVEILVGAAGGGGAGVICGDLTPECTAMVQAVLDTLAAPRDGDDPRTRPRRYHDALAEAMS